MIRINLHPNRRGAKYPLWAEHLINKLITDFSQEYDVTYNDSFKYFFNCSPVERIAKLFADAGITVETYNMEGLPSLGILIPEDNPVVVEYKLRYISEDDKT